MTLFMLKVLTCRDGGHFYGGSLERPTGSNHGEACWKDAENGLWYVSAPVLMCGQGFAGVFFRPCLVVSVEPCPGYQDQA